MSGELEDFLSIGWGAGDGSGAGFGDGLGYSLVEGFGRGRGSGDGYRDGDGFGHGDSYSYRYDCGYGDDDVNGIKTFNGQQVFYIDDIPTLLDVVHGAYAKGSILNLDLTLEPTYVAKVGRCFAHGRTLREARADAVSKDMKIRPVEERISEFIRTFPVLDKEYAGCDLFDWHGNLTGSCRQGRMAWCKGHGFDPKTTRMTVRKFCRLTMDSYGGAIIRKLLQTMKENAAANGSREA